MRTPATFAMIALLAALGLLGAVPGGADTGTSSVDFTLDLRAPVWVLGLEVTQGVQDIQNSVALVEGRSTSVRVHVRSGGGTIPSVEGRLEVRRAGALLKTLYATGSVKEKPLRTSANDSFFFELPVEHAHGDLELKVTADRLLTCGEPAGVSGGPDDTGAADCTVKVRFQAMPALKVALIPMSWTDNNVVHMPGQAEIEAAKKELLRTMPLASIAEVACYAAVDVSLAGVVGQPDTLDEFALLTGYLEGFRASDGCKTGCTTYYFGILKDPPAGGVLGMAGAIESWVFAGYSSSSQRIVSHEVGHCLARRHTNYNCQNNIQARENDFCLGLTCFCCVRWPCASHFPSDGTIGGEDRDTWEEYLQADTVFGLDGGTPLGPATPDLMSYGKDFWPSKHTYTKIREYLASTLAGSETASRGAALTTPPPALLVGGILDLEAPSGQLRTVQRLDGPPEVEPATSDWAVRVDSSAGTVLATYPFVPPVPVEGRVVAFSLLLPWDAAVARVVLLHGTEVLDQRQASTNLPIVQVLYPNGGESLGSTGTATATWSASDLDGDTLTYVVQHSADAGVSWSTVAMHVMGTSYGLDLSRLRGSNQSLVRVIASDGFHASSDQSDSTFNVATHAPSARVTKPEGATQMLPSQLLILRGEGLDVEDGQLGDAALGWASSLVGPLGTGRAISVDGATLGVGTHTITLTATDHSGSTGTATVAITVGTTLPPRPATLACAPKWLRYEALEHQPALTSPQVLGVRNDGHGTIPWTASADQAWIVLGAPSGSDEANLEVRVNASALVAGEHTGAITITAAGAAASPQVIAVTVGVAPFVATAAGAPLSGPLPLHVSFEATTAGAVLPVTYLWSFGDGTPPSSAQNPAHVFTTWGDYLVTLNVTDSTTRSQAATPLLVSVMQVSGDANGDGSVNVADVFYLINHLFGGGPAPVGPGDANGDTAVNVADVFYLINYLFAGGAAPF